MSTSPRIVRSVDVLAVRDDAARTRAAVLQAQTERQDAIAAAYAAGLDDGRDQAHAAGAAATPRLAAALEQLLLVARETHSEAVDRTSRAVLASAVDIAEWILRHELPTDTRSILSRLSEAAAALLPSPRARVVVSPTDAEQVQAWARTRDLEVVVDPALPAGDALFHSGDGTVEVTVAAALRIAAEALGIDPARGVQ